MIWFRNACLSGGLQAQHYYYLHHEKTMFALQGYSLQLWIFRLDYQPLFGKRARAPPREGTQTGPETAAEIELTGYWSQQYLDREEGQVERIRYPPCIPLELPFLWKIVIRHLLWYKKPYVLNSGDTYFSSSNNRITSQGALCIAKGLEGNNTLEVLKVIFVLWSLSRLL